VSGNGVKITAEVISLRIPADPRFLRVARMAASSVGSLVGLALDDLEDLKIGVGEVVTSLLELGNGNELTLEFQLVDLGVELFAYVELDGPSEIDEERAALGLQILDVVADEHQFSLDTGRAAIWFRRSVDTLADVDES